jgi:peptide/nickel transport system substrate-binding protein
MTYSDMINSEFNINPIGSGPFRFDRLLTEGNEILGVVLKANNGYYGEAPFLQEFVFRYYPDVETAFTAYLQGKINGIGQLNEAVIVDALKNPGLSVYSLNKPEIAMVLFNLKNTSLPFFQEAAIRRALLMGLDRRGMIDRILNGQGVIADVPLLPNSWAYYSGNQRVDQNIEAAKDILVDEGYILDQESNGIRRKDDTVLSFTMVHPNDDYHTRIAQFIQSDWEKLGVTVRLEAVPYDSLILDHLQPLTYQAALIDINYYRSPDPDPYPFWDQSEIAEGQNYSQWENRVISQYLAEARVTRDQEERAKLYRNFQVIFIEEMPALPLFYPVYNFAIDDSIQGVRVGALYDPSDRFWNVTEWFLLAQSTPVQ